MPASSWKVEDLVPHRPPMVLIDGIESFDPSAPALVATFTGRAEWRGNWSAIEYMAQAAAALAGALDRAAGVGGDARPGLLLGARRLELGLEEFIPGERYFVKAVREYADGDSAAFACEVWRQGVPGICCTATLAAYRMAEGGKVKEEKKGE